MIGADMKRSQKVALYGLAGSFMLSALLIHMYLAELVGELTGISPESAGKYLFSLLTLLTLVRAVLILMDKDDITKLVEKIMKN
jgi:hypothetical protein